MYAIFRVWLYAIISAGVDSTTDVAQVKRIKLSNVFSLFGITGFLFFILLISFFKWWLVVGFQMVFVVLFCLCILLNYYKKYNLSRFLYILSFAGFILFFGWLDYTHTIRVHYYLFILPLMIFVMFEVRQSSALIVAFTIVVATFVAINEIDSPLHFHNYSINDRVITIMHLINVLFIFLFSPLLHFILAEPIITLMNL